MAEEKTWTISSLANEFGVTARTIRYYEEKGLITPKRTSGDQRLFDRKERTRLKLILRGKRFGLTLDEIADILGSTTADLDEVSQVRKALHHFDKVLGDLAQRKAEIEKMQSELLQYVGGMKTRLVQLEGGKAERTY